MSASATPSVWRKLASIHPSTVSATAQPALGLDPSDNALAESVIGLFKAKLIHRPGPWKSFEAVEYKTLEWVDWFNHQRLLELIGNIPPAEAEANQYAALEPIKMAA